MTELPNNPPDRSRIATEQRHADSMRLHAMETREIIEVIQAADREIVIAMEAAADAIASLIESAEPGFCAGGRLIYVGAGTSGRLGVLDASEAPPTFCVAPDRVIGIIAGGDQALRKSGESMEDDPRGAWNALVELNLTAHDTLIGIAAGGTTPYVLGIFPWLKTIPPESRPVSAMITCSPIPGPAGCDHLIVLNTGPEIITGSTRMKAGTATKLALNTISTTLMIRSGRVYENLMVDLRATNAKLRDRTARIITTLTKLDRRAALELLDQADGHVKTALVMHETNLDRDAAEALLVKHEGRLDRIRAMR